MRNESRNRAPRRVASQGITYALIEGGRRNLAKSGKKHQKEETKALTAPFSHELRACRRACRAVPIAPATCVPITAPPIVLPMLPDITGWKGDGEFCTGWKDGGCEKLPAEP